MLRYCWLACWRYKVQRAGKDRPECACAPLKLTTPVHPTCLGFRTALVHWARLTFLVFIFLTERVADGFELSALFLHTLEIDIVFLIHTHTGYRTPARGERKWAIIQIVSARTKFFISHVFSSAKNSLNVSPPSAAHIYQWTGSTLVQIMACHLFGAKLLSKPMLGYCQLGSWEQVSVKFESEFYHFHSRKGIWKFCLPRWQPFCPWGDELKVTFISEGSTILSLFT